MGQGRLDWKSQEQAIAGASSHYRKEEVSHKKSLEPIGHFLGSYHPLYRLLLDREKECLDNEYKLETFDHKWEIDRNAICITGTLGEGAFGKVVLAEVKFATTRRKAAVKTLKEGQNLPQVNGAWKNI